MTLRGLNEAAEGRDPLRSLASLAAAFLEAGFAESTASGELSDPGLDFVISGMFGIELAPVWSAPGGAAEEDRALCRLSA